MIISGHLVVIKPCIKFDLHGDRCAFPPQNTYRHQHSFHARSTTRSRLKGYVIACSDKRINCWQIKHLMKRIHRNNQSWFCNAIAGARKEQLAPIWKQNMKASELHCGRIMIICSRLISNYSRTWANAQ